MWWPQYIKHERDGTYDILVGHFNPNFLANHIICMQELACIFADLGEEWVLYLYTAERASKNSDWEQKCQYALLGNAQIDMIFVYLWQYCFLLWLCDM